MPGRLRSLLLHNRHVALGARMVPFAGWEMPLQYAGILQEHAAVRERAGVFDVSHLGRVWVRGREAGFQIRSISTFDALRLTPGQAHYTLYCNEDGGIVDDVFIYRVDEERWLLVHNAANAEADFARVDSRAKGAAEDVTAETVMLAVQGPAAVGTLRTIVGPAAESLEARTCMELDWEGGRVLVGRTGYTGEDGVECITDGETAGRLWAALLEAGVAPVGLGARDTLRLEASLPLHGNDIDAGTQPYEAGLGWAVTLDDEGAFRGREALERLQAEPRRRRLSQLRAVGRGVPRRGYAVHAVGGEQAVSSLTSGAFSPTLRVGIGMAYLPVDLAKPGTRLEVDVRGRRLPVEVVRRPFYRRPD